MSKRIGGFIRSQVIGLTALFIAISGVAYAATDLERNSVRSKHIKNGQVKSQDVKDDALTGADVNEATLNLPPSGGGTASDLNCSACVSTTEIGDAAITIPKLDFDPATQPELDALAASDGSPPNSGSNFVHWNVLNGVPAGFADGTDDTGGTASDVNCTGCVGTSDLANAYWELDGNTGTNPATDFVGTTDNQPLNLRVNNARALRLEPASDGTNQSPNVIGGIADNAVTAGVHSATISGGGRTDASSSATANRVTDNYGTVGGGGGNRSGDNSGAVTDSFATVGGGAINTASGVIATIGGGLYNIASGNSATVGGGAQNVASGEATTVGGGVANTASGTRAMVLGGENNVAAGRDSFAAGRRAQANHDGAFVWSDSTGDTDLASTAANQFIARASGRFFLQNDATLDDQGGFINTSTGAYLSTGGTWTNSSDENLKAGFSQVNSGEVLDQVAALPIETWHYKAEPDVQHIGPVAQDFYESFGVGPDERHIASVDADGIALAAIKGLNDRVEALSAQAGTPGAVAPSSGASLPPVAVAGIALLAAMLASLLTASLALRWSGRVRGGLAIG